MRNPRRGFRNARNPGMLQKSYESLAVELLGILAGDPKGYQRRRGVRNVRNPSRIARNPGRGSKGVSA